MLASGGSVNSSELSSYCLYCLSANISNYPNATNLYFGEDAEVNCTLKRTCKKAGANVVVADEKSGEEERDLKIFVLKPSELPFVIEAIKNKEEESLCTRRQVFECRVKFKS
jgi:hypothetical protein